MASRLPPQSEAGAGSRAVELRKGKQGVFSRRATTKSADSKRNPQCAERPINAALPRQERSPTKAQCS
jgi:hypothetical protein